MTAPISFIVRPPSASYRPSPLGNGSRHDAGPPSRRFFEQGDDNEEDERRHVALRPRDERVDGIRNGRTHGYAAFFYERRGESDVNYSDERPVEPLVIPAIPNRDWRQAASRRVPSFRPENQRGNGIEEAHERTGVEPQNSGLRYAVKTEVAINGNEETVKVEQTEGFFSTNGSASASTSVVVKAEPLSLDEQALQALLAGDARKESADERAHRELVIAMESDGTTTPMTEEDAYKRDVAILPDEVSLSTSSIDSFINIASIALQSTLDDYQAVPVSAFGMAMVRGMGWNPSSKENMAVHEPKLRPQLLGLGATPMDVTIRPTHNRGDSKKRQQDRNARSGRGFIATSLMVKRERDGATAGSITPVGSGSDNDAEGIRRRRREEDYDDGREKKRRGEERSVNGNGEGYRERQRYETEEQRSRRKEKEREEDRWRLRNGDRDVRQMNGGREDSTSGGGRHNREVRREYGGSEDRQRYKDSERERR